MKCEICGASPAIHCCDVRDGKATSRLLCETHAGEAGLALLDLSELFLKKYRRVVALIKATGRLPNPIEIGEELPEKPLSVQPESKPVANALAFFEALVQLVETHRRMPTDEEVAEIEKRFGTSISESIGC